MKELSLPPLPRARDVVRVESSSVSCDGEGRENDLGHPLIYLTISNEGQVTCPYCSRKFVLVERS